MKLALLTPNADPTIDLGQELAAHLRSLRLDVPGIELRHAVIDHGPLRVESEADEVAAAREVARKARVLADEGCDAIVIDCMSEPGLAEARRAVAVPVVGPRSAVLAAAGDEPVAFVRDEAEARLALASGARILSMSSTGLIGLADALQARLGVPVLDPLAVAFREAVRRVRSRAA